MNYHEGVIKNDFLKLLRRIQSPGYLLARVADLVLAARGELRGPQALLELRVALYHRAQAEGLCFF